MKNAINIIVTCTSRKTQTPLARFHLGNVGGSTVEKRAQKWIDILSSNGTSGIPASDLYCGEYWSVVRSLPSVARDAAISTRIWVCSAGYGLIAPDSRISPYAATFSHHDADSVTRGLGPELRGSAARAWWRSISMWPGPEGNDFRTASAIAQNYPRVPLMVVASSDYLQALEEDLTMALNALADPSLLLIVSAGTKRFGILTDHLLPSDARLQSNLGGTRITLNIRIAKLLLETSGGRPIVAENCKSKLRRLLNAQPPLDRCRRRAMSDEQIRGFIRSRLHKNSSASRTLLLRQLRDAGRACEQSRFASLYEQMVSNETIA